MLYMFLELFLGMQNRLETLQHSRNHIHGRRLEGKLQENTPLFYQYTAHNTCRESSYPHTGSHGGNLDLNQDPNVVDELERHVHQFRVDSAHINLSPGDEEHIVCLQLLLDLVCLGKGGGCKWCFGGKLQWNLVHMNTGNRLIRTTFTNS